MFTKQTILLLFTSFILVLIKNWSSSKYLVLFDSENTPIFNHPSYSNAIFVKNHANDITAIDHTMRIMDALKASLNNKENLVLPDNDLGCHNRYYFNDSVDERILSMNLVPLTLGVRVEGGYMSDIIPRNTTIPITETQTFSTLTDHQKTVKIMLFEGEDIWPAHNHYLGELTLTDLPLSLGGAPKIEVTFKIDIHHILTVEVNERVTGQFKSLNLGHPKSRLNQDILDNMLKRDFMHDREDVVYLCEFYREMTSLKNFIHLLRNELAFANDLTNRLTFEERALLGKNVKKSFLWLQSNPYASPSEFNEERKQLESVVLSIITGSDRTNHGAGNIR